MMEKILVNMVQKALAKQQAAENQIVIENNNRLKTRDIEDETNQSNPDKTEGEGTSSGSDPGGKGGGEKEKVEEVEEKFPWRKPLVESAKLRWQKKLVEVCENETVAKKLLETRQKWRGNIIADMGEDGLWKVNILSSFLLFVGSPMHCWPCSQSVTLSSILSVCPDPV